MGMIAEKRTKQPARKKHSAVLPVDAKSRADKCSNCGGHATSCRRRTFSEQALTVLLLWNEINPNAVDQAICEDCYQELRDVLIDRSDEIEIALQKRDEVAKIRTRLSNLAS